MVYARLTRILPLLVLFVAQAALAIDFVLWEPGPGYPAMVIPAVPGSTAEESVRRYLRELNAHPDLAAFGNRRSVNIPVGKAEVVAEVPATAEPTFGIFANRSDHLFLPKGGTEAQVEMTMVRRQLTSRGAKVYVLPLVADAGLPPAPTTFGGWTRSSDSSGKSGGSTTATAGGTKSAASRRAGN